MFIPLPSTSTTVVTQLPNPIGLEIELCSLGGFNLRALQHGLNIHLEHDGSVSGDAAELVVEPLCGDKFLTATAWLGKYLNEVNCAVDDSCGLHVHIGAQGFGPYELRRLMWIYNIIQPELYNHLLPASRQEPSPVNGKYYCRKFDMTKSWWRNFIDALTPEAIRQMLIEWVFQECPGLQKRLNKHHEPIYLGVPSLRKGKYQIPSRYYGLNLHSWFVRGTVEWRHFPGTLSIEDLLYWPLFCGWVVNLAAKLRDKDVARIDGLDELISNHWRFGFTSIAIPDNIAAWVRRKRMEIKKQKGIQ